MVHTLDIIYAKQDVFIKIVKNLLLAAILFMGIFDEHIAVLLNLDILPIAEIAILAILPFALFKPLTKQSISALDISVLLLLLIVLLVGLTKTTFIHSFIGTIFIFKTMLVFLAGSLLADNHTDLTNFMKGLFWLAVISGFVTFLQVVLPLNPFGFGQQSSGLIGITSNPNKNGLLLVIGFILSNLVIRKHAIYRYLLFGFFFGAVLLSQSRQSILIFGAIFLIQEVILHKRIILLIVFLFALSIILVFFPEEIFYRFGEIERIIETGNYFRLKALLASFEVLYDYPLFGVGPGMFGGAVANVLDSPIHEQYSLFAHWENYKPIKTPSTIDMYWPHVWAEIGVIGTSAFLLILGRMMHLLWKGYRQTLHPAYTACLLMIFVVIISSLFSMSMESTFLSVIVFIFAGMLIKTPMPVLTHASGTTPASNS